MTAPPIAREGYPFIAALAVPALLLWLAIVVSDSRLVPVGAIVLTTLALAVTAFFRDPERSGPRGPGLVISAADGKVVDVRITEEPEYVGGETLRISVFLSLLDVHVNRYPVSGTVEHRRDHPGRYEPAWRNSASHGNERASTGIRSGETPIMVRQVAGTAARRIVTYARPGDQVEQGERMGLIRFGSRTDVYLPPDATPAVSVGDRVRGGITVIARVSEIQGTP